MIHLLFQMKYRVNCQTIVARNLYQLIILKFLTLKFLEETSDVQERHQIDGQVGESGQNLHTSHQKERIRKLSICLWVMKQFRVTVELFMVESQSRLTPRVLMTCMARKLLLDILVKICALMKSSQ